MRIFFIIAFSIVCYSVEGQTLGGHATYNFLNLPSSTLLTGAGGVNTSYQGYDIGLASNNPALLTPELNGQMGMSFNSFLGGIKSYSLSGAFQYNRIRSTIGGNIYFVDYGSIQQTDAVGNVSGTFHPVDFVVQGSIGNKYLENWSFGATIKFIHSSYQPYSSSALAFDVGVLYSDTTNKFSASILAKNMGFQLKTYAGEAEDLPFDLQIGITKRLANAPFGFSFTAQHVHQFNILYNDTTFNNENGFETNATFFTKLLNHFVIASHIYLGSNLEAIVGYNHLRRSELNIGSSGNGLNGFSIGVRAKFQKLQILFSRSNYQRNIAYNQLGLNIQLNKLFGLGE